jgi:hypothetical protein
MCQGGVADYYQRERNVLVIFTTQDDRMREQFHEYAQAQVLVPMPCPAFRMKMMKLRAAYNADEMERIRAMWRR